MSFCTRCGTRIAEDVNFCTRCGQRVAAFTPTHPKPPAVPAPEPAVSVPQPACEAPISDPAPQPVYAPAAPIPEPVCEPSVPQPSEPPTEKITQAVSLPVYEAPAPIQQPEPSVYQPPVYPIPDPPMYQPPQPPMYQPPQPPMYQPPMYQPPVRKETPANQTPFEVPWQKPSAPKEVKSGGKIGVIIACIVGALAVIGAIVIGLLLLFGGKDDPNLGLYEAVSCDAYGIELDVDGKWIKLKSGGMATLNMMDEEYSCKWTLDGKDLTVTQSDDVYQGTLIDGVITLDFNGMVYTFVKEHRSADITEPATQPEAPTEAVSEVGYWTLQRTESENSVQILDEETIAMFKDMGMEIYIDLKEDGTGSICIDQPYAITWGDNIITVEDDGSQGTYEIVDNELRVTNDGVTFIFVPGEPAETDTPAIEIPLEPETEPEVESESTGERTFIQEYWEGEWYGWWIIRNGSGEFEDDSDTGRDAYARITVFNDDTGYLTLWDSESSASDSMAECSITFTTGITDAGTMISESGQFYDCQLEYADWFVDAGLTIVSEFNHTIAINGIYTDPENPDNSFEYYVILRPWGMYWDDVFEADNSDNLYSDMMPFDYDSWYIPLLEAGISQMPDSFAEGEEMLG